MGQKIKINELQHVDQSENGVFGVGSRLRLGMGQSFLHREKQAGHLQVPFLQFRQRLQNVQRLPHFKNTTLLDFTPINDLLI